MYIPNSRSEIEAERKIKEIIEVKHNYLGISDVGRYDFTYGEMLFSGNKNGKTIHIKWNYFNGDILIEI